MSKRALKPVELDMEAPGKDISRLFTSSLSHTPDARQPEIVPIDRLLDNPYQPRLQMSEETLNELTGVIGAQGFQGVLVARPHSEKRGYYQLTAGHRRREAARRAGLAALPVVVQDLTDEEMVTLTITENIQRDDLTPLEEGRIYLLMKEEMGYTLEGVAREVGKTLGYIYNRVRVAKAPPDVQALVEAKPDSLRAVANLIKVESAEERAEIIGQILAGRLTTDDLPLYIRDLRAAPELETVDATDEPPASLSAPAPGDFSLRQLELPGIPPPLAQPPLNGSSASTGASKTEKLGSEPTSAPPHYPTTQQSKVVINGVETVVERAVEPGAVARAGITALPNDEERARIRARKSKLARILSMLQALSDDFAEGDTLSKEEKLELATIAVLAERLCLRFEVEKGS